MNRIYLGYDARQPIAFHVASQSIINHTTQPVSIAPLKIETLPITRVGLTPFTFSRFLVPWLCGFQGKAIYMDSDFLCRTDLTPLFEPGDYDVSFVAHERKFERSSMMVFNCEAFAHFTPEFVQTAKALNTCDFAQSPGILKSEWNHLVGYDQRDPHAKLVHFTQGLPCYDMTRNDEFGEEWRAVARQCLSAQSWEQLMGPSIHAPHVYNRAGVH